MKSNYLLWVVLAAIIVLGGAFYMKKSDTSYTKPGAPTTTTSTTTETKQTTGQPVTFALNEQSGLGQSGTATLTPNADGTLTVTLALSGGTFSAPQPSHIHLGSCPTPGGIKFDLDNVVNGKSETLINASWSELVAAGEKLALNVHKSGAESKVYTACGNLPLTQSDTTTTTGAGASVKVNTPAVTY